MLNISPLPNGLQIAVQITPRSSRNKILKIHDQALKIAVQAPPVDNAANAELVQFLAKTLQLNKRDVSIISGHSSKRKVLQINNLSPERLRQILVALKVQ